MKNDFFTHTNCERKEYEMRKFTNLLLSALMVMALTTFTACGMGNTNDGSEAPYEDDVKDTANNGVNNGNKNNMGEDIKNGIDDIGDDIKNGIDNVEDGIQNGIDDIRNGMDDLNNRGTRTSRLEEAGKNLIDSVREASAAIRDGLVELSQMR
jgi:hypothetical protein